MTQSRRMFLVSAATAGSATALFGGLVAFAQPPRSQGAPSDPVLEQVVQEVFAALRELEGRVPPRLDAIRSLAVMARLSAAHLRGSNFDRRLSAGLQRIHNQVGRERLIDQALDPALHRRHQETLRAYGLQGHYGGEVFARDKYHEMLDGLLAGTNGMAAELDRIATMLDVRYRKLAARAVPGGGVVIQVQDDCALWQEMCAAASVFAQIQCMVLGWLPEFGGIACLMAQAWAATCCYMSATCGR